MKTFDPIALDATAKSYFDDHGWILFKNVFSQDEIKNMREAAKQMQAENHRGDLFSHPKTSSIVYDERIVSIVKRLLDTEKPIYYGDSNYLIGARTTAFHKDNPDRATQLAPDWQSPYTILRMGIYLQDHKYHSEGLALRDRSHGTVSLKKGRLTYIPTEPGDLIVWSLRTTHAGTAFRLRFAPNYFPHERIYWALRRKLPESLYLPREQERIAFFISYAKSEDHHFDRYLKSLKTRKFAIDSWLSSKYDETQIQEAEKLIKIMDFHEEAKKVPSTQIHEDHVELEF